MGLALTDTQEAEVPQYRVGVDVGGTFTDLVMLDRETGETRTVKTPSTPAKPSEGILNALGLLGIDMADIEFFAHGTTVGTNALITRRKLSKTALICTRGFRDVLEIGRGPRPDLWDAYLDPAPPYVRRRDRFEVTERIDYQGAVVEPLVEQEIAELVEILRAREFKAVAVCLLHSYVNGDHERRIGEILERELPGVHISLSHVVLPEIFEFERTSTTVINACLAPVLTDYLDDLESKLNAQGCKADVLVLHSGGGVMQARTIGRLAARAAKSGPAGGAAAMASIANGCGFPNAIGLDVGGTSSDISLMIDGELKFSNETSVEYGYPIMFPSVDVVTIGAGGGSVAWVDGGGSLRNGPQSQGADPGPACYLRGGTEATNTDANLILGRLSEDGFLGGQMSVSRDASLKVVGELGEALGLDVNATAAAILRVANANMAGAMRLVTIRRGYDPRDFALVAFGGAGPLHAADVARDLDIPTVIVPTWPGLTSALGCMTIDTRHDLSKSFIASAEGLELDVLNQEFEALETIVRERLSHEGFPDDKVTIERMADMRYLGQWRSLTVRYELDLDAEAGVVLDHFHAEHERAYAYSNLDQPVEIYGLRVVAIGSLDQDAFRAARAHRVSGEKIEIRSREVYFDEADGFVETAIYSHDQLPAGYELSGPAIVEQMDSTVVIPPKWDARVDEVGNIILTASGVA